MDLDGRTSGLKPHLHLLFTEKRVFGPVTREIFHCSQCQATLERPLLEAYGKPGYWTFLGGQPVSKAPKAALADGEV